MILITGATGTVGSRLVELLLDRGEDVRVFCRDVDKARAKFGERVQVARGDLEDPGSVRAALEGVERIFLLAPPAPEQLQRELNVIAAARETGIRRLVKLSVLAADEHSPVRLARGHREAEKELEASELASRFLPIYLIGAVLVLWTLWLAWSRHVQGSARAGGIAPRRTSVGHPDRPLPAPLRSKPLAVQGRWAARACRPTPPENERVCPRAASERIYHANREPCAGGGRLGVSPARRGVGPIRGLRPGGSAPPGTEPGDTRDQRIGVS